MTAHRRALIFATFLILGFFAHVSLASAQGQRATVFLDGFVGAAPAGTTTQAAIVLEIRGTRQDFAVTGSGVVRGKRSSRQILNDIRPKQNLLILMGPQATLDVLRTTPSGQPVRITGEHQRGSNQLIVTSIGAPPAARGPAAAPTGGK